MLGLGIGDMGTEGQAQTHARELLGGGVAGTVKYAGPIPTPAPLHITKDREVCGSRIDDPSLVIGRGRGIANAVVTITGIAKGEPLKLDPAVKFDQKGCEYIPHVAVFPAGSTRPVQRQFDVRTTAGRSGLRPIPPHGQR